MDTSEKYIEMCRAAEEIQKEWEPAVCDWRTNSQKCMMLPHACRGNPLYVDKENDFWLPRQDQLQGLLNDDLRDIAEGFYDYMTAGGYNYECPEFNDARCKEYGSMEQLWLAYVMETKYRKQWDGVEWIDPDAQKEPTKSLSSQIFDARNRLKCDHVKPTHVLIHQKACDKLMMEIFRVPISTNLYGGVQVFGLKLVVTDTVPEDGFTVVGVPL